MASKKGVIMYYDILDHLEDFTDEQFGKTTRGATRPYEHTDKDYDKIYMKYCEKKI